MLFHFSSLKGHCPFTWGLSVLRDMKEFSRKRWKKGYFLFVFIFFHSYPLPFLTEVRSFLQHGQASTRWLEPFKWASASIALPGQTNARHADSLEMSCWPAFAFVLPAYLWSALPFWPLFPVHMHCNWPSQRYKFQFTSLQMQECESAPWGNSKEFIIATQEKDVEEVMCFLYTKGKRNRRLRSPSKAQEILRCNLT